MDNRLAKSQRGSGNIIHKQGRGEITIENLKDKFHNFRGKRGLDVANISDDFVQFEMQVLAYKLLRKCHKDEVSVAVIAAAEKCVEGVQMN
jgi:hypothetical protein